MTDRARSLGEPVRWDLINAETDEIEQTTDPAVAEQYRFIEGLAGPDSRITVRAVYRTLSTPPLVAALPACDRHGCFTSIIEVSEADMLGHGDTDHESDAGASRADFLAAAQVAGATPYYLGYRIESYDPATRTFAVRVSNNLHEMVLADGLDPTDLDDVAANYEGPAT